MDRKEIKGYLKESLQVRFFISHTLSHSGLEIEIKLDGEVIDSDYVTEDELQQLIN